MADAFAVDVLLRTLMSARTLRGLGITRYQADGQLVEVVVCDVFAYSDVGCYKHRDA